MKLVSGVGVFGRLFCSIRCILSDPFSSTASESFLQLSLRSFVQLVGPHFLRLFNVFPMDMRVSRTKPEPLCF